MGFSNTDRSYGGVTKTFHWLTALLILTAFPLGMIANDLPFDTDAALARKVLVFSLHKTVGVTAFVVALARILWALTQTKPGLLNADNRIEAFLAELIHWMLYAGMLIVPLSGWLHHAATTGFAPIWWPFGQSLPFVPKSEAVGEFFAAWHWVFTKVLGLSVLLHIAGAVKHRVIDRDQTIARMWFGPAPDAALPDQHHSRAPLLAAAGIFAAAMALGSVLGLSTSHAPAPAGAPQAVAASEWQVQEGSIAITVKQMGSLITGSFADWTAVIGFDETATDGRHGTADVTISTGSLSLGSVTAQATAPDFFHTAEFPTAQFFAELTSTDAGYVATGALTIKGKTVPVTMPFDLTIVDGVARVSGQVTLNRQDFGIGESYPDEGSVGFDVVVDIALTATRDRG